MFNQSLCDDLEAVHTNLESMKKKDLIEWLTAHSLPIFKNQTAAQIRVRIENMYTHVVIARLASDAGKERTS